MKINSKFLYIIAIVMAPILSSCGGGGSSSPAGSPPVGNDPWALVNPTYSGLTTDYEISASNAPQIAYNTIEILDLLNLLVYGEELKHFFFLLENAESSVGNNNTCESGSVTTVEVVPQEKIEIRYNNCLIEGVKINGIVRSKQNPNSTSGALILNLDMEDVSSGEIQSFSGYIDILNTDQSRFHLLISNSTGEEIWFDNFVMNVSLQSTEYGIFYQGNMYISDKGKLTISTANLGGASTEFSSTITISGTQEITINAVLQNNIEVLFGQQYIPLQIPLTSYPESLFDDVNEAPQAVINNQNSTVDRSQELNFSSANSNDPDFDFLTFKWEIISQPVDSQPSIQSLAETVFISDLPGYYTIRLTVEDTVGNISQTEKTIKVLKNKPAGSLDLLSLDNVIGKTFQAQVNLTNDIYDGPFVYKIKYGPANINVDPSGLATWDGVLPDYGKSVDINFAVYVENEDKNSVFGKGVAMKSESTLVVEQRSDSESVSWGQSFIVKKNNRDEIYFPGLKLRKLFFEVNNIKTADIFPIGPSKDAQVYFQALQDANNDGIDDYWYSSINNKTLEYSVSWLDGITGEENIYISFERLLNDFIHINFSDYDMDGKNELIISNTFFGTKIINLETKQELITFSEANDPITESCDFNADGFLDFVYTNKIIDAKNNQDITPSGGYSKTISLDSTNECKLLKLNEQFQVVLFDLVDGVEKIIFKEFEPRATISLLVGNFDLDISQEVIVFGRNFIPGESSAEEAFIIDDLSLIDVSVTPLTNSSLNDFSELGIVEAIADLDGNGVDELIFTPQVETELVPGTTVYMNKHVAIILDGNDLVEDFSSKMFLTTVFEIEQWLESDSLYLTTTQLNFNLVASSQPGNTVQYLSSFRTDVMEVTSENLETFVYWTEYPNRFLIKQDLNGNEIWRTDIQKESSFGVDDISILGNGIILIKRYDSDILIHPVTGEILFSMPLRISFSGTQHVFISSNLDDYFADMRTKSLLKIDNNYTVTEIKNDAVDSLLADSTHYSFVQFDDDEIPEVIAYSVFNQNYNALDLLNQELETSDGYHNGIVENWQNISSNNLLQCFNWDKECRNFISNSSRGDAYEVIDKLTGTVIWRSPKFGALIREIQFQRNLDSIATTMSHFDGFVFTLRN